MSEAVAAVAAAILGIVPGEATFPTIGIVRRVSVIQDAGVLDDIELWVAIPDRAEPVRAAWSGAIAAEILALADDSAFVSRRVKVELIDGVLVAAYTINGTN